MAGKKKLLIRITTFYCKIYSKIYSIESYVEKFCEMENHFFRKLTDRCFALNFEEHLREVILINGCFC